DSAIVERVKKHLSAHFWISAERSLQNITDSKLEKASANALMWTAGVATDKALLLEGKPTARVEVVAGDQELNSEIARLEGELAGWKSGQILNAEGSMEGDAPQGPTEGRTS